MRGPTGMRHQKRLADRVNASQARPPVRPLRQRVPLAACPPVLPIESPLKRLLAGNRQPTCRRAEQFRAAPPDPRALQRGSHTDPCRPDRAGIAEGPKRNRSRCPSQVERLRQLLRADLRATYENPDGSACATSSSSSRSPPATLARPVHHGPDARSAELDLRLRPAAVPRGGLDDAQHDPLGQGLRVGRRAHHPRRRRHDPVGHGHRQRRTRSTRSGGCSTSP